MLTALSVLVLVLVALAALNYRAQRESSTRVLSTLAQHHAAVLDAAAAYFDASNRLLPPNDPELTRARNALAAALDRIAEEPDNG